ncbi:MAG: N-acetylmuramoyl-L-alanine amidase [Haliscomenobacter sp.]|nr:N-acetylmuramoyl-L-alanine amidase [Haliscomenobacter sp.]
MGSPLAGIKVSIEAGHGGSNTGAEGLSGLVEKDVNLDVALRLEKICRESGMEVLQVRPTDTYMTLEQKRTMVERSDADLHVSIHANSGGGGYLRVGGVSTYYHNPHSEDFARTMYGELLKLGLAEFGVVGSFNYHVTRMSSRPAILVEMAFLSHAEDEEKLASPRSANEWRSRFSLE